MFKNISKTVKTNIRLQAFTNYHYQQLPFLQPDGNIANDIWSNTFSKQLVGRETGLLQDGGISLRVALAASSKSHGNVNKRYEMVNNGLCLLLQRPVPLSIYSDSIPLLGAEYG